MSRTLSPSTGKRYGLARVAAVWDLPRFPPFFFALSRCQQNLQTQ